MTRIKREEVFDQKMQKIFTLIKEYSDYDLVIGIPFRNDMEQLPLLLKSLDIVLTSWMGRRQLIICVGNYLSDGIIAEINKLELKHPHLEFLLPEECSGRGSCIRAIIEISKKLDADLLLFSATTSTEEGPGIEMSWLESLLTPIQGRYDLVLGSTGRQGIESISHMLVFPVLETFYGFRIREALGGIYAISHDLIEDLAHEALFWAESIGGYGIDFWLLSRALCWNKNVCQVNLGGVIKTYDFETRNKMFFDTAHVIFEALNRDNAVWMKDKLVLKIADILAKSETKKPYMFDYSIEELMNNFQSGVQQYYSLLQENLPGEKEASLKNFERDNFCFTDELWVEIVFNLMIIYYFKENKRHKVLEVLTALYNGKVASDIIEMQRFYQKIDILSLEIHDELMVSKMESLREHLVKAFRSQKADFTRRWLNIKEQVRPALIPLGYMEYLPGKPIVIPKKLVGKDRRIIETDNIYKKLRRQYFERFNRFITEGLGLTLDAAPEEIVLGVEAFISRLERTLEAIFPGDLHKQEGIEQFVAKLFELIPLRPVFSVNIDVIREMLVRFPPINLMIPFGYYKPEDLVEKMDPRHAVTYANLIEAQVYTDRDLSWLANNIKPESFEWVTPDYIILPEDLQMGILARGKISGSNSITARITIRILENGKGGKYPRLRYFTSLLRRLAVVENYSNLFQQFVAERKDIGCKIRNSLLGLHKGDDFSAYNIFENYHHRMMIKKVRDLADKLSEMGEAEASRLFNLMADSYGLSQVLEDSTFLTCTAWSWASYSFKGGIKIPGPWTTSVEGRWFNHDFLEELYRELGYDVNNIMPIIFRFIQSGRSAHNLLDTLLPTRPKDVTVVVQETTNKPSKSLKRFNGNPILKPLENHQWESKYVLNPGALRIGDKVYLFYRAVGEDNISRIGLAVTDGYNVLERLSEPIFSPATPEEKMGCEDPRVIILEDKIIMLYTAYDGNLAQIAAASIKVEDFINKKYTAWKREGLAFKNIWDKDAIIFPEKINGKYVIYHRIEPSIWVTYVNEIKFPLKEKHAIIVGPRPGRMWDSLKIGAGAQPLKSRHGWLLIYHGVDHNYVYSLGGLLVDLNNPSKVLYRSPNPILQPETEYEIGLDGAWVPNVVFTCGAINAVDKEILEDDDEILVYYGAADTSIGVARATLADLIPKDFR